MLVSLIASTLAAALATAAPTPLAGEGSSVHDHTNVPRLIDYVQGTLQSCVPVKKTTDWAQRDPFNLHNAMRWACDGVIEDPAAPAEAVFIESTHLYAPDMLFGNDNDNLPAVDLRFRLNSSRTAHNDQSWWVLRMGTEEGLHPKDFDADRRGRCYDAFSWIINNCGQDPMMKSGGVWRRNEGFYLFTPGTKVSTIGTSGS